MTDLSARAVILGTLVDTLGTLIAGEILYGVVGVASGVASAEELSVIIDGSVTLQLVTVVLGLAMTAAGAYVAARAAKANERAHAFAVGVVSTVLGFTVVFATPESAPFWAQATSLMLTIPAAFVGGEIRRAIVGGARPAR